MGSGVKGSGSGQGSTPISDTSIQEQKKTGGSDPTVTTEKKEEAQKPPASTGTRRV
jgi:hypothetical protein